MVRSSLAVAQVGFTPESFHSGDQDLHDTKAELRWEAAPCWAAVTNDMGAQRFKNGNWITTGRPNTTGQIQHPRTQPQGHQHAPRAHTTTRWQPGPMSETATAAAQRAGPVGPYHSARGGEVGGSALYLLHVASPQWVNMVSSQSPVSSPLAHAKDALPTMPAGVIRLP